LWSGGSGAGRSAAAEGRWEVPLPGARGYASADPPCFGLALLSEGRGGRVGPGGGPQEGEGGGPGGWAAPPVPGPQGVVGPCRGGSARPGSLRAIRAGFGWGASSFGALFVALSPCGGAGRGGRGSLRAGPAPGSAAGSGAGVPGAAGNMD